MSDDIHKLTDPANAAPDAEATPTPPVVSDAPAGETTEDAGGVIDPEETVDFVPKPAEESAAGEEAAAAEPEAAEGEPSEEEAVAEEVGDDPEEVETPEEAEEAEPEAASSGPIEETPAADEPLEMNWYILKVQSNRERSISDALRRKVAIEGLDDYFGEIVVPTEKVTEFKNGKKKIVERKLYPGYIVVNMHINDDTWFAVRETSGIGDFTGAGGKPTPMLPHEVARIVQTEEEETDEAPKLDIKFKLGDGVKVKDGTFEGFEGEVSAIDEQSGKVTVMINIFGRSTPVELEYWQIESV